MVSPLTDPTALTLLELKKSKMSFGLATKANSAKPMITIKNIERSLIFDNIAIVCSVIVI
jgi:hypothetical protein